MKLSLGEVTSTFSLSAKCGASSPGLRFVDRRWGRGAERAGSMMGGSQGTDDRTTLRPPHLGLGSSSPEALRTAVEVAALSQHCHAH